MGVFYVNVYYKGSSRKQTLQFLTVHWFGQDPDWLGGACHLQLDQISYVLEEDPEVVGFLDPSEVLHACPLMPAFLEGKTTSLLGSSIAQHGKDGDWVNYYVIQGLSILLPNLMEFC